MEAVPSGWFEEASGARSEPRATTWENDLCKVKLLVMHRPTHEPQRDKDGDYPFSWHLNGRKRLWELRLQLHFKRVPQDQLFFSAELSRFVQVSGMTRQAQKALVAACQTVAGECYHSNGDDPSTVLAGKESEPPTFAMPLWAFDQFEVSNPGSEPDLKGDLDRVGMRRCDGAKTYIDAMKAALGNLSTDKVYTFCLWGVSQFLDCIRWEIVGGVLPGMTLDFNRLCGAPPAYLCIYELANRGTEKKHMPSMKRSYIRVAAWSSLHPPNSEKETPYVPTNSDYSWDGCDLLDLGSDLAPVTGGYGTAAAPSPACAEVASVDLLGLG